MFELVGFSEIDNNAMSAYCSINDIARCKNLGDIHNVSKNTVNTDIDLIFGGTPCQDFSTAGAGAGCTYYCNNCNYTYNPLTISNRNRNNCPKCGKHVTNKTRSALMLEFLRVIKEIKPKMFVWENVLSVATHKKYRQTYNLFINELKSYGYNIYEHRTNALTYGIPQHRQRIFIVGIQKLFDTTVLNLTNARYRSVSISDILQPVHDISNNLWLSDIGYTDTEIIKTIYNPCTRQKVQKVYEKIGYIPVVFGLRNTQDLHCIPCITTNSNSPSGDGAIIVKQNNRLRKISVLECFRSMGFNDNDYEKIQQLNLSDHIMRQLVGNSIVTDVLVSLYRDLYCSQPHLFNDNLKVLSVCSGIGAFEYALKIFYDRYYTPTNAPVTTEKYTLQNCLLQYSDLLTTADLCNILQCSRNTVHSILTRNNIPTMKNCNKIYVSKSDIITYLNSKTARY